jgi:hypothetical protein
MHRVQCISKHSEIGIELMRNSGNKKNSANEEIQYVEQQEPRQLNRPTESIFRPPSQQVSRLSLRPRQASEERVATPMGEHRE